MRLVRSSFETFVNVISLLSEREVWRLPRRVGTAAVMSSCARWTDGITALSYSVAEPVSVDLWQFLYVRVKP